MFKSIINIHKYTLMDTDMYNLRELVLSRDLHHRYYYLHFCFFLRDYIETKQYEISQFFKEIKE